MERFTISRINTPLGIFRLAGVWQPQSVDIPTAMIANISANISVDAIAIMGTDGWVELRPHDQKVIKLINELAGDLHQHLLAKSTST
ncbi:hypothetical protein [Shewanella sp. SR44-3]|uniref:hypothetical protein n=1 Tax=unclassified Shewanella TaxID=196818 RepID=UPI0015FC6F79|nr:hypothetical protein [Shewanella sp. SR44-3]MBB1270839.1 hypothetical protein [Shewanella sp. SR44-3]